MNPRIWFSLLLLVFALGCGKSGSVSAELRRIADARYSPARNAARAGVNVNSNLTITSLKVPIRGVALTSDASGGGGATIYECAAGTNDGCLVDLASASELENLLSGAAATSISAGTYGFVQVSTCMDEGTYTAKIQASGPTDPGGGTTHYTQAGSGALSTNSADAGEATVYFTGCSRTYPLPSPVTVAEGGVVAVKLYFDIRDIAFFGNVSGGGNEAWYSGGYSFPYPTNPTTTYVGVNYLDVAGTIDSGTPTTSRYRVTSSQGDLGTIGLMYTSGGDYFGGYSRSFFSTATTQGHNRFVTPLQTFSDNGDGTFTIANYGSSATGAGYFNATTFVKATSATPRPFTDASGTSFTYTIEALP